MSPYVPFCNLCNNSFSIWLSILAAIVAIGLLIGMFQAATSINEQTLAFIPKLIILLVSLMIAGEWMLHLLINFTKRLYLEIPFLLG